MTSDPSFPLRITETANGIQFSVHIQPRAAKNEICGLQGEELKIRITSPPVDDAANRMCTEFLARTVGVAKSRVTIVSGAKSRHKTVRIAGIGKEQLLELLR